MRDPIAGSTRENITDLVDQSTLGMPGVRQLSDRVPSRIAEEIRSRANAATVSAPCDLPGDDGSRLNYYAPMTWTAMPVQRRGSACPYRGLNVYEESDQELFFGRDGAVTEVMDRLSAQAGSGFVVVSGISGAGKSSLLRAGVLPRLRRDGIATDPGSVSWPCLLFIPGKAPLTELASHVAALAGITTASAVRTLTADPGGFGLLARQAVLASAARAGTEPPRGRQRLILVIDQFEQIFTQCRNEAERRAFVAALHSATFDATALSVPAALVVLGVRADFEARCAEYPELTEAFQQRYLLTAMSARQLRRAITGPAEHAGVNVDPALTDRLLEEVRGQRGVGRAGYSPACVLPLLSYALSEAWRARAGQSLTLDDYERTGGITAAVATAAQRAYDGLTAAQQDAARLVFLRLTATSGNRTGITGPAAYAELAQSGDPADVQAVMDAFTRERLLTLNADGAEIACDVLLAAWPLLRDNWLKEPHPRRPTLARGKARRRRPRARLYALALLVLAAVMTASAFLGDHPRDPAKRHAATAETVAAESRAVHDINPSLSAKLAVAAYRLKSSSADARYALLAAAANPESAPSQLAGTSDVSSVEFSPDGDTLATYGNQGEISLWNTSIWRFAGLVHLSEAAHTSSSLQFSSPGMVLATTDSSGTVVLRLAADEDRLKTLESSLGGVGSMVSISPDGKTLAVAARSASASSGGSLQLWDISNLAHPVLSGQWQVSEPTSVEFSANGASLAVGTIIGVQLRNVVTGQLQGTISTGPVSTAAFSADGSILAVATSGHVELWNALTASRIGDRIPGTARVSELAFSPDGKVLAVTAADDTQLWDVATSQVIASLAGASTSSDAVAFSPDGALLAVGTQGQGVYLWNMSFLQPARAASYLCSQASQALSAAQWKRYVPGVPYENVCP